jgi:hypothetical protein
VGQVSIAHLPQRLNGRVQERQFGPPTAASSAEPTCGASSLINRDRQAF